MRRPRVILTEAVPGSVLELSPAEAHHLVMVLRKRAGDGVEVLTGSGGVFAARIEAIEPAGRSRRVLVRVEGPVAPGSRGGTVPWTVAVSGVKESLDWTVRLASELGLERLVLLACERTEVRVGEGSGKLARWRRIACESAKQCGRLRPLAVDSLRPLGEVLDAVPAGGRVWLAHPGAPALAVRDLRGPGGLRPDVFLVGPEGGFTPRELAEAEKRGGVRAGFAVPVLRTPTAVVLIGALGALLQVEGSGGDAGPP